MELRLISVQSMAVCLLTDMSRNRISCTGKKSSTLALALLSKIKPVANNITAANVFEECKTEILSSGSVCLSISDLINMVGSQDHHTSCRNTLRNTRISLFILETVHVNNKATMTYPDSANSAQITPKSSICLCSQT